MRLPTIPVSANPVLSCTLTHTAPAGSISVTGPILPCCCTCGSAQTTPLSSRFASSPRMVLWYALLPTPPKLRVFQLMVPLSGMVDNCFQQCSRPSQMAAHRQRVHPPCTYAAHLRIEMVHPPPLPFVPLFANSVFIPSLQSHHLNLDQVSIVFRSLQRLPELQRHNFSGASRQRFVQVVLRVIVSSCCLFFKVDADTSPAAGSICGGLSCIGFACSIFWETI